MVGSQRPAIPRPAGTSQIIEVPVPYTEAADKFIIFGKSIEKMNVSQFLELVNDKEAIGEGTRRENRQRKGKREKVGKIKAKRKGGGKMTWQ